MSDGGKGSAQRPTDQKKWSSGYENINWTKEEDEEFERIAKVQDGSSTQCTLAQTGNAPAKAEKDSAIGSTQTGNQT